MNATTTLEKIREAAEKIKNGDPQRFPEAGSAGDYFRQGDIYVTRLDKVPDKANLATFVYQLAVGETRGARHCLDAKDGVTMYRVENADVLTGPVIDLAQERTITHPEHGDLILTPGVYSITYQRQFAEELKRVMD